MVGVATLKKPLNVDTVNGLEFLFQLATMADAAWKKFLIVANNLESKKVVISETMFRPLQGCNTNTKISLLDAVMNAGFDMRGLKADAANRKFIEKVSFYVNFLYIFQSFLCN
jgi:hypothetical protein